METKLLAAAEGMAFAVIVFLWMWVAKQAADLRIRKVFDPNAEIEESSNLAVGLRRAGLYLGLAIGMTGALAGGSTGFQADVLALLAEGAVLTLLLLLAQRLTDAVVVRGVRNDEAVRDGNVAVGLVELGISLATGLIAFGAFAGEGGGLLSAVVFFLLGQIALLLLALSYERVTPYRVIENIREGNVAAGLMLAGMLLAFGFILSSSIAGPSRGWAEDLLGFGISAGAGIALLLLLQWPIDKLFLPGTTLRQEIENDRNAAAIAVTVSVKIALALVIASVVI